MFAYIHTYTYTYLPIYIHKQTQIIKTTGLQPKYASCNRSGCVYVFMSVCALVCIRLRIDLKPHTRMHMHIPARTYTALTTPSAYIDCGNEVDHTMEDLCIVYKLYRSCGRYINLRDWLDTFIMVCIWVSVCVCVCVCFIRV